MNGSLKIAIKSGIHLGGRLVWGGGRGGGGCLGKYGTQNTLLTTKTNHSNSWFSILYAQNNFKNL